jgi:hypothetical protein
LTWTQTALETGADGWEAVLVPVTEDADADEEVQKL